jgi:hypothetical protein
LNLFAPTDRQHGDGGLVVQLHPTHRMTSVLEKLNALQAEMNILREELYRWKKGACCDLIPGSLYTIDATIVSWHGYVPSSGANHMFKFIGISDSCEFYCNQTPRFHIDNLSKNGSVKDIEYGHFYVFDTLEKYSKKDPFGRKGPILIHLETFELHYVEKCYMNLD